MIRCLLFLLLLNQAIYAAPTGYLWYNLPKEKPKNAQKTNSTPFASLSFTDKDAVLKFYTLEALHKVRHTHNIEDERKFLSLQNYWLKEAAIHGKINQLTLLKYPEYDFSITHPTSNLGVKLQDAIKYKSNIQNIKSLAKTAALMFFYKGANPIDRQQIQVLLDFCKRYDFKLLPVSMDGRISKYLPNSKVDKGQAKHLGVRYFPAILIVNPKTKTIVPVAFGLTTQDVLTERLGAITREFVVHSKLAQKKRARKLSNDFFKNHALLYFFKSNCTYCKTTSPIIKKWTNTNKAKVYSYTLDDNRVPYFKEAVRPTKDLIKSAFADNNLKVPALFVINTDNSRLYPAVFGALDSRQLNTRMQNLIKLINDYERKNP